ncbi:hypothetical protein PR202_ga30462 [Eleusine coracana subsp. coracana]|uniref:phospholipase D n=1 Tax=Eleusine coracana subsp. coracana TaxID=191504 RepID=A0AAV5DNG7_ELECO|nr:hypothetical protein PR202_ga30462 [Eleusine coracana subsp. coracana]
MGKNSAEAGTSLLLHGDLDIQIVEAKCLPNMDLMTERMRKCFTGYGACSTDCRSSNSDPHPDMRKIITSDPYVSVCLSGATVAQTRVIANSENPKWDEHFYVQVAHSASRIEFHVKDNDVFGAELIGVASIPVEDITPGEVVSGWFPISGQYSNPMKPSPELHLSIQYKPIDQNPLYKDGVGADGSQGVGVPNAYFPLRKGGKVTLYQDAHVPDDFRPPVEIDGGKIYEQNRCWEDICHAILEAHHLIYIVGWSLYHPTRLVVGTLFTHHQKCVIVDTQATGNNRKITAFIGGLDLCDGRYDTPEHRLFKDLDTVFKDDFHNPTFPVFRSIDSGSVKGFPKLVQEAESQIDKSIHNAYVKAIRSAQHFIYIENQYFIGSSYYWSSQRSAGAENLIPIELAIKIARKIKARERFAAYIVIPMWPEGNPTTAAMQEILYWQGHTMSMMYKIVADALRKEGLHETHPQEYLNFYCLGKREITSDVPTTVSHSNENSTLVYGYRMSLWAEHLGTVEECFRRPESMECVRLVNQMADDNWASYVSLEMVETRGHLLRYPVTVDHDGRVGPSLRELDDGNWPY